MHADRVNIFHTAHRYAAARSVADNLEFNLLPALYRLFEQHLSDARKMQPLRQNFLELLLRLGDAAARAAERIRRADDYRVADFFGKSDAVLQICNDFTRRNRLICTLHQLLEAVTILALFYRCNARADDAHIILVQNPAVIELAGEVQSRLSAHSGNNAVRALALDYLLDILDRERLDIGFRRNPAVGHNRRRVGVHEHGFYALLLNRAARLRSRVVKFRCLTYNNRS